MNKRQWKKDKFPCFHEPEPNPTHRQTNRLESAFHNLMVENGQNIWVQSAQLSVCVCVRSEAYSQISRSVKTFLVLLSLSLSLAHTHTHTLVVRGETPSSTCSTAEQGGCCLATVLLEKA